ncbi:hypothetical protein J31TS4_31600 [Paenibacillus sp. J31TS4]|uniref:hypothetical protein n=1 Tax=Paenibacillus sp. J31TS4 TaxID=2807195 RepID=UPI001B25DC26|nr:hypothetical protein [Paenibacillus sp. J31TS4]GIP39880.1 hypothetical protein J31TS4_31600 [Paenibacillus sp. J31TS4]
MAKLKYDYDPRVLDIGEKADQGDVEFQFRILQDKERGLASLRRIRDRFHDNPIVTDVLFYQQDNGEVQVIVRGDFYEEFILALMKHRLLRRVWWEE